MNHSPQTPHSRVPLPDAVNASLIALAWLVFVAGCATTPTTFDPATGQVRPLTPQELLQRRYTDIMAPPSTSPNRPPATESQPAPQNTQPSSPPTPVSPGPALAAAAAQTVGSPHPSTSAPSIEGTQTNKSPALLLREGDTLRISFPGAPTLNTVQQIRRDGNITLPLIGEFKAAGLAPSEAEKELLKLYDPHLQVKEVNVAVESSAFAVYVTGAVLRPGKIMSDRPISAMEAVVEAGINHSRANLKAVRIIRQENGRTEYHSVNLKVLLQGKPAESFALKPSDIIYVPERFTWF